MAIAHPYLLFGGKSRKGGLGDYLGAHTSVDECLTAATGLAWFEIAVVWDDGLNLVRKSDDKPAKKQEDGPSHIA